MMGALARRSSVIRARWVALGCVLLAGCDPDPGACDIEAAGEIVYDPNGVPAFAGQALVVKSCGGGAFCHSESENVAELADRFGAPDGLSFDLRLASLTVEVEPEETQRLVDAQLRMVNMRGLLWQQVRSRQMPPDGPAGDAYAEHRNAFEWDRFADDGITFSPLPDLDTSEGREIYRNWLACDVPVIERTEHRIDREFNATGWTVHICERTCVDPSWPSIYEQVVVPSCARSRCHDGEEPGGDLDLATGGATAAHARMFGVVSTSSLCGDEALLYLAPGEPDLSLFYLKVAADTSEDVCGARMPLAGNALTPQRLCAIREWIACGACLDPDDSVCATCIAAAREDCGVAHDGGEAVCIEQAQCGNRCDLDEADCD